MAALVVVAALGLLPGIALAQSPPPPTVLGTVVEQGQPAVQGETLVNTGSNLLPSVVVALILIGLGTLLVVGVRRRRDEVGLA